MYTYVINSEMFINKFLNKFEAKEIKSYKSLGDDLLDKHTFLFGMSLNHNTQLKSQLWLDVPIICRR